MEVATDGQECARCGEFATKIIKDFCEDEVPFCEDCLSDKFRCESCDEEEVLKEDKFSYINGELYCSSCSPFLELCISCGIAINVESDLHEEEEGLDGILCEDCMNAE